METPSLVLSQCKLTPTTLTLGGGFGVLTGRHGLVIDNLIGATMVLADGTVVAVDEESQPDVSLIHYITRLEKVETTAEPLSSCGVSAEEVSTLE